MKVDYHLIGTRIKECRQRKNLTQEKLASDIKCSPGFVSLVETGKKKASLETLLIICKALDITLNELLTGNQILLDSDYNAEYAELTKDCDEKERRLIYEITKAVKEILIKNR